MPSSPPPIPNNLRVDLRSRDGVVIPVPLPTALRMGYTAGLIEDLAEGVMVLEVPFPFLASAARTVLRLAGGERCGTVFSQDQDGGHTGLSKQHGGAEPGVSSEQGLLSLETLAAVVDACDAASYLQAAEAEHALLEFVARSLRGCASCGEVCDACGIAQGPLSREEAALVARLASQSDKISQIWGGGGVQSSPGAEPPSPPNQIPPTGAGGLGQGGAGQGAGCDVGEGGGEEEEEGNVLASFRADSYHALYGGVLFGGVESLNGASPLRLLSDDLLSLLAGHVAARIVPDDGDFEEVLEAMPDFATTGVRLLVRPGSYHVRRGVSITSKSAAVHAFGGDVELWSSHDAPLVSVGGASSAPPREQGSRQHSPQAGSRDANALPSEAGLARVEGGREQGGGGVGEWEGTAAAEGGSSTAAAAGGGRAAGTEGGSRTGPAGGGGGAAGPAEGGGRAAGAAADAGEDSGAATRGSHGGAGGTSSEAEGEGRGGGVKVLLHGLTLTHRGTEGDEGDAGARGYWDGGAVAVRVLASGWAALVKCRVSSARGSGAICEGAPPGTLPYVVLSESDVDGREGRSSMLLPYHQHQLIEPRALSRWAHLRCLDCHFGPFPATFGCAIVASMRAHLLVRRCAVRGAKLDGIIAAVGGEAEVDSCDIQGCGESGVVASGVSTYETSDESGTVMVERSVTRVTGTRVTQCHEEALWACESGLVLHSSCQIVENGGDMRGVTGGEVHPLFPAPG